MESEFLIKFAAPMTGLVVGVLGSIVALLTFWQKQKTHRIALAEKLHLALESGSKLLAMEAFSQLTGLRYKYSDIELISEDNDALQRLIMLKRRRDEVTFSEGEYNYAKSYVRASKSIGYWMSWVFFILGLILVVTTILALFAASVVGKFVFTYAAFLAASILLCVYSASEVYWYREADRVLKLESEKRLENEVGES
ncbi:hypothetical protein NBRC116583_02360 [Arenicella sp. 4NH20-0111]|uniref:hypothetical protein n=1 Tax=Arenicella sp. 4NH20-0111 TaxID=3127648 RepID=UPI003102ADA2